MSESPEDEMEVLPQVSVKPLLPAIPGDDKEYRELKEDHDDTMKEFLFLRGNQWDETPRRDLQNWTPDTWCEVYGFKGDIEERWAGRKDGLFAGKFNGEVDPKEGLHPGKCRNPRERRMLEFMLPILNPENPKRLTLIVANTLFGALSGVRPVNWGIIIHDIVEKGLALVGRKTSYLSPFSLHLYSFYGCTTVDVDDMLILAEEESVLGSSRWPKKLVRRAITQFRMRHHPQKVAPRKLPGGPHLPLLLLHITIPLPLLDAHPLFLTLPNPGGGAMAKRGFIRVDISGKPLPTGVRGSGQPPTAVPPVGAHYLGS